MLKRGISDVVGAVLLILLVFIAVIIVWTFVKPLIERSSEESNTDCILARIEPRSCTLYDFDTSGPTKVNVTVFRGPGKVKVTGTKLVFDSGLNVVDINDSIVLFNNDIPPRVLETKIYTLNISGFNSKPANLNVAAVIGDDKRICNVMSVEVNCL